MTVLVVPVLVRTLHHLLFLSGSDFDLGSACSDLEYCQRGPPIAAEAVLVVHWTRTEKRSLYLCLYLKSPALMCSQIIHLASM